MNYDRIILELLDRVSKLEEEVRELKGQSASKVPEVVEKEISYTDRVVELIKEHMKKAREDGKTYIDLLSIFKGKWGLGTGYLWSATR